MKTKSAHFRSHSKQVDTQQLGKEMRKRSMTTRKSSAADTLVSPLPTTAASLDRSPSVSPLKFEFNFNTSFKPTSSSSLKKEDNEGYGSLKKKNSGGRNTSALMQPTVSPPSLTKSMSSISDLKDLVTSRLDSLKSHLDCSHSEIVKEIEASDSRLYKRLKIQTQTCQQVMDEAEKEYKKMKEQIDESQDAMKASYMELIAEAHASGSRVSKTSIPELVQSFEKSIDALRSRFGVTSTSSNLSAERS